MPPSEKLSSIVRSLVVNSDNMLNRSAQTTPVPWDPTSPAAGHAPYQPEQQNIHHRDMAEAHAHGRNESNGGASGDSGLSQSMSVRRPEWDAHSLDSEGLSSRHHRSKNPIPNPSVLIRSELPTITRSRQQQSLTCLVTVEMPEGKWQPDMGDLHSMRPRLSQTLDRNHRHGPSNASNRSNRSQRSNRPPQRQPSLSRSQPQQNPFPEPIESAEELERVTEDLHSRVDNWHGLDFSRLVLSWTGVWLPPLTFV